MCLYILLRGEFWDVFFLVLFIEHCVCVLTKRMDGMSRSLSLLDLVWPAPLPRCGREKCAAAVSCVYSWQPFEMMMSFRDWRAGIYNLSRLSVRVGV